MPYATLFSAFTDHIHTIVTNGGYFTLFVLSLLEGLPILGTVVPGHVAIILAGFFARIGTLNLALVISIAALGAIIGDYIGFIIGRKYGLPFIDRLRPYFSVTDSHIDKARDLLDRHTGKAMIIGRFSPFTRALMPFLVGAGQTSTIKFWLFNVIGAVSWAVISALVGYVFGAGYHIASVYVGGFVVIAIIFALLIIWGYRFVNIRFHIFRRYELFILALNIIALWGLARTIQDAWAEHSFMASFDIWVNGWADMLHQVAPFWSVVASWVSTVGGTMVIALLGAITGLIFILRKKWRSAVIVILSVGGTGFMLGLLKEFFLRVRPENALQVIVNDPSFPSGHAGMAAAFFVVMAYLLAPKIRSWIKRELFLVLCVLLTIIIGLSRVILNVHWASDVMAGWALGIFIATAVILLVRYMGALVMKRFDR